MYRVFCESYENFLNTLEEESYRKSISKPFELILNIEKYKEEERKESLLYKRLCDLIYYMEENANKFPRLKAFLWTLSSREMVGKKYNISSTDELDEQIKLINSFLKLAYWY